ncbi:MAG: DUF2442 domain-containing protein [Cyanobacteria bacterium]|nr:DUF2442 domain-containing protein [Cyanobacteriota bacterium]
MASVKVSAEDRERYARAREAGRRQAQDPSAITGAHYNRRRGAVELSFAGGGMMTVPRELIAGLEDASIAALSAVSVSPAGDAVSWRALDVDVYVPGLVERAFGKRLFAASTGRKGGRRTSRAKAAAAKANGAKGGRPPKSLTA